MNARTEIRDALLLKKMNHWLLRARCPQINPRVPVWRARKNYWALIRKHGTLAAAHHLTVASVF